MADEFRKELDKCGAGGFLCTCCLKKSYRKYRVRQIKRSMRNKLKKFIDIEIKEDKLLKDELKPFEYL